MIVCVCVPQDDRRPGVVQQAPQPGADSVRRHEEEAVSGHRLRGRLESRHSGRTHSWRGPLRSQSHLGPHSKV